MGRRVNYHTEHLSDRAAMLAMRAALKLQPKLAFGPEARPAFDTLMAKTSAAEGVTYEPAVVAGVQGWWCHPQAPLASSAILYLHGGAYVVGTAWAYRNFVGQLAERSGVSAFIPDYALAPERPFPAAFDEVVAIYAALAEDRSIAVVGDSAGGGLALALLTHLGSGPSRRPNCGVLFSPWVDLSLSGASMTERADHDPLLTRDALAEAATLYLGTGTGMTRTLPASSVTWPACRRYYCTLAKTRCCSTTRDVSQMRSLWLAGAPTFMSGKAWCTCLFPSRIAESGRRGGCQLHSLPRTTSRAINHR